MSNRKNNKISELKNIVTNMFICYNNLTSKESMQNRESDNIVEYKNQESVDTKYLVALRNHALNVFDICNELLMK